MSIVINRGLFQRGFDQSSLDSDSCFCSFLKIVFLEQVVSKLRLTKRYNIKIKKTRDMELNIQIKISHKRFPFPKKKKIKNKETEEYRIARIRKITQVAPQV